MKNNKLCSVENATCIYFIANQTEIKFIEKKKQNAKRMQ